MAIDFSLEGGVAVNTINRPEVHNALDAEHYELLSKAWVRVRDDPGCAPPSSPARARNRFAPGPTCAVT